MEEGRTGGAFPLDWTGSTGRLRARKQQQQHKHKHKHCPGSCLMETVAASY